MGISDELTLDEVLSSLKSQAVDQRMGKMTYEPVHMAAAVRYLSDYAALNAKSDIDRIVGKASNGMPTTHKYAPTITFKPWTPPRPTLDQMPEGEPHRCCLKDCLTARILHIVRHGTQAYHQTMDGRSEFGMPDVWHENASAYTVLDADPPQPETLADVPSGVWCESSEGGLCVRSTTKPDRVIWLTSHRDDPENETAQCELIRPDEIEITRVLGTPVFGEGGE